MVKNYTIRFKSAPIGAVANTNQILALDLPDFLSMLVTITNATSNTANNVRSVFNSMRVRRIRLWSPPQTQLVGNSGSTVTGYAGKGAWIRLGAPNTNGVVSLGQNLMTYEDEPMGLEPAFLEIVPPKVSALGAWFSGVNSVDFSSTITPGQTNIGAFTCNCQGGSTLDFTFDVTLNTDVSTDTVFMGYRQAVYSRSHAVGQIVAGLLPYTGTLSWTPAFPYTPV